MSHFFVICFDIRDDRRLRKVSKVLENYGRRVQRSVFECRITEKQLQRLQTKTAGLIDEKEDQIRYYPLCPKDVNMILLDGKGEITEDHDYIII